MTDFHCNIITFAIVCVMSFGVVMTSNPYYEVIFVFIASVHVRMTRRVRHGN